MKPQTVRIGSETARLESIRISGFRSLADVELSDLGGTSVLIGPNGSGKSNLLRFFDMLSWMLKARRLGEFVERHGGADDQLHGGARTTPALHAQIGLETASGRNEYRFTLADAHPDKLIFTEEAFRFSRKDLDSEAAWTHLGGDGHREARIVEAAQSPPRVGVNRTTARTITHLLRNCAVYQFHDTSDNSNFKKRWDKEDSNALRSHGGNLPAILYRLEHEDNRRFEMICRQIARVLPVFDRFQIEESYGKVILRWKARWSDKTFGAHLTSDGSLRFFALATLLNLPREMLPDVLLLDEPELGLHPAAVTLMGDMIKTLSHDVQVIVATQSPLLVDVFDLGEIIILELEDGRTKFRTVSADDYRDWLDENFSPGELWQKNLLGGRP
ncbi:MAG: AAA family ATPase [Gammaproteobacteria bacterium]|nr:AAA family ATPase [Gammaproteobacteria bacterium]